MFLTDKKSPFPSFSPFRSVAKRSAPHDFDLISRSFDESILRRLKTLKLSTSSPQPSISLSWLSLAVDFLSSTHAEAQKLISELTSSSGSSDDSRSFYLDHSVKLLDICNSISSEIEKLRHRRLLMNFVLHLLEFPKDGEIPAPDKLRKASESLADWVKNSRGLPKRRGFEVSEPDVLIRELAEAIVRITPRGRISSVGKAVLHTIYAVGLVTVFVAGIAVSALYELPGITKLRVPAEFLWAGSVNALQSAVFDGERRIVLTEIDDVVTRASVLRELIGGVVLMEDEVVKKERLKSAVKELKTVTDSLSEGLDSLADDVNKMFRNVLSTRNGVLENYRVGPHEKQRK